MADPDPARSRFCANHSPAYPAPGIQKGSGLRISARQCEKDPGTDTTAAQIQTDRSEADCQTGIQVPLLRKTGCDYGDRRVQVPIQDPHPVTACSQSTGIQPGWPGCRQLNRSLLKNQMDTCARNSGMDTAFN